MIIDNITLFIFYHSNMLTFVPIIKQVRPIHEYNTIKTIPPHGLWVEGDDRDPNYEDSGKYGPVNSKLVLGHVERIIWPPSRYSKVRRIRPANGRAWWPF